MMMMFGLVPFLFVLIGLTAFGVFRRRAHREAGRGSSGGGDRDNTLHRDSAVFGLARHSGGRITLSDVVVETGMNLAEAEQYMNSLVDNAHVSLEVDGNGKLTYEFREFLDESGGSR